MNETNPELYLLARHLSGVATPKDEIQLRAWITADQSRERALHALEKAWEESSRVAFRERDIDAAWARIMDRLQSSAPDDIEGSAAAHVRSTPIRKGGRKALPVGRAAWRAAAIVCVALASGFLWRSLHHSSIQETARLEITVPRGQEATVRLPDGSSVVLAPASTLRYPRSFGDNSRELWLEGMGYFEVVHDPERPFLVHAGAGTARVLGTRFVVRAYPDSPDMTVAVTQGEVALHADATVGSGGISLTPGQVGRLDSSGLVRLDRGRAAREYLGWMNARPLISNRPLPEALAEIERWYDVNLAVHDSLLATRRITTTIERSSLRETLAVIALALDAKYVQRGDTVVFVRNR